MESCGDVNTLHWYLSAAATKLASLLICPKSFLLLPRRPEISPCQTFSFGLCTSRAILHPTSIPSWFTLLPACTQVDMRYERVVSNRRG